MIINLTPEQNKKWDNLCLKLLKEPKTRFLTSLLYSLKLKWADDVPTAGTNGIDLIINPKFFYEALSGEERIFTILHELWHVAKLHSLRCGDRDKKLWNVACDYHVNSLINNDKFVSIKANIPSKALFNPSYDKLSEEEIYDLLKKDPNLPANDMLGGDVKPLDNADKEIAVAKVLNAVQSAKAQGLVNLDGVTNVLSNFLKPKINWRKELRKFMTEALDKTNYTWSKPNRRFSDIYLPSLKEESGKLTHLVYCLDVSGSITASEIKRFNSEVKYIKEQLNPDKLTLVQFDTKICRVDVFTSSQKFTKLNIIAGGGTSYVDVREFLLKEKPTAAVIFTDLCCNPMEPIKIDTTWVTREQDLRYGTKPLFGKLIVIPGE